MKIATRLSRLPPFWFGMAIFVTLFVLVGIGVATWQLFEDPLNIQEHLQSAKPYLFGWRVLLLVLLIGFWPQLMTWIGKHSRWDNEKLQFAIGWRWRAALWLLVIEVGLIQGVIGVFLRNIFQG